MTYNRPTPIDKATFSDAEIEKMRTHLAKTWRQSKSQVTDAEARFYLRYEAALRSGSKDLPPEFSAMVDREFWNLLR